MIETFKNLFNPLEQKSFNMFIIIQKMSQELKNIKVLQEISLKSNLVGKFSVLRSEYNILKPRQSRNKKAWKKMLYLYTLVIKSYDKLILFGVKICKLYFSSIWSKKDGHFYLHKLHDKNKLEHRKKKTELDGNVQKFIVFNYNSNHQFNHYIPDSTLT